MIVTDDKHLSERLHARSEICVLILKGALYMMN